MSAKRTSIERNPNTLTTKLMPGIVLAILGGLLLMMRAPWWSALLFLTAAACALRHGWVHATMASCPTCDMWLHDVASGDNEAVLCAACGHWCEGKAGELWAMALHHVADHPLFRSGLPEIGAPVWPVGCVVCGGEVVHHVDATYQWEESADFVNDAATRIASLGFLRLRSHNSVSVAVPHCKQHNNGALLERGKGAYSFAILFRSHEYHRLFCASNHVEPISNHLYD